MTSWLAGRKSSVLQLRSKLWSSDITALNCCTLPVQFSALLAMSSKRPHLCYATVWFIFLSFFLFNCFVWSSASLEYNYSIFLRDLVCKSLLCNSLAERLFLTLNFIIQGTLVVKWQTYGSYRTLAIRKPFRWVERFWHGLRYSYLVSQRQTARLPQSDLSQPARCSWCLKSQLCRKMESHLSPFVIHWTPFPPYDRWRHM